MKSEAEERAAVAAEALTWERTPFHWEGTVKGAGVDCGRYLACVFNNAGVKQIDLKKLPRLSPQWFLHRRDGEPSPYLESIKRYAVEYELAPGQVPQPGDIVVARQGRDWAHGAIVLAWPKVIGAAYGHVVTTWQDIHQSPQYTGRELTFLNPWGERRD